MKVLFSGSTTNSFKLLAAALAVVCVSHSALAQKPRVALQIIGSVRDSGGNPIARVGVGATLNGATNQVYVDTDTNGNYALNVTAGTWDVSVNCSSGSDSLGNVGSGYLCCNDETVTITTGNKTANFITPQFGTSELSGNLYNANNVPLVNITVYASDTNDYSYLGTLSTTTDGNGFYQFGVLDGYWTISVNCGNLNSLGYACVAAQTNVGVGGGMNTAGINFYAQSTSLSAPFFTGQTALGNGVFFLANNTTNFYGYYSTVNFPYVYHYDLGFEYFFDASNSDHGAYIYDFTSGHFWYTSPAQLPNLYDFTANSWLFCFPNYTNSFRYQTNPRYFHNYNTGVNYAN